MSINIIFVMPFMYKSLKLLSILTIISGSPLVLGKISSVITSSLWKFSDTGLVYFLSFHFLMIQILEMRKLLH